MRTSAAQAWAPSLKSGWVRPREQHRSTAYLAGKRRIVYPAGKLEYAIKESQSILALPTGWDDAGSPAFRKETRERAVRVLMEAAGFLWATRGLELPAPSITPGPEGSIDLHWKTARRELLINIPEDPSEAAPYYGDDYGADKKKGIIDPGNLNADLFVWLAQTD